MEAGKPIPIYGDGSMGRDYTYVDDIVARVRSLREHRLPSTGVPFNVFNLGNSHPVMAQTIEHLEAATGRVAIRDSKPLPPGDVPLIWAIGKSSKLLGYRPQTRIEDGLRDFVACCLESRSAVLGQTAS
jgi:UDP-glucuronate 4-epimerase